MPGDELAGTGHPATSRREPPSCRAVSAGYTDHMLFATRYETTDTVESPHEPAAPGARLASAVATLPGTALALGLGALAAVRRNKPVHPAGKVGTGSLEITSPRPELGVPVLATTGAHACVARYSRTVGLPATWPDIDGLALRIEDAGADVLLASTGVGRIGRFVFRARAAHTHGPVTTYLPVSTRTGSLLLRATPLDQADPPTAWELSVAHLGSAWRPVGVLRLTWGADRPVRFDPVANSLPGTRQYPVVTVLREPAYMVARRLVPRPRG